LTYASLRSPDIRSVALRNFSAGGNGKVVHVICGEGNAACAPGAARTLAGSWDERSQLPLTPGLVSELTAQRIYVEVLTGRGPELRAQLEPQPFMAGYTQYIGRISGRSAQGPVTGTAAVWLVAIPPDKPLALVDATVAGENATLRSARLGSLTLLKAPGLRSPTVSVRIDSKQIRGLSAAELQSPVLVFTLATDPPVEIRTPLVVVP